MNCKAGLFQGFDCLRKDSTCQALHGALDMFAQLFHEPLFTPDASYRELQAGVATHCYHCSRNFSTCHLEAIESEFQKKKRSDTWQFDSDSIVTPFAPAANV